MIRTYRCHHGCQSKCLCVCGRQYGLLEGRAYARQLPRARLTSSAIDDDAVSRLESSSQMRREHIVDSNDRRPESAADHIASSWQARREAASPAIQALDCDDTSPTHDRAKTGGGDVHESAI